MLAAHVSALLLFVQEGTQRCSCSPVLLLASRKRPKEIPKPEEVRPVCLTRAFWPFGVWKRLLFAGAVGLQEQGCSCGEGSVQLRDRNTAAVRRS